MLTKLDSISQNASLDISQHTHVYRLRQKVSLKIFWQFSQQSLEILKRNFTNLFSHPIRT